MSQKEWVRNGQAWTVCVCACAHMNSLKCRVCEEGEWRQEQNWFGIVWGRNGEVNHTQIWQKRPVTIKLNSLMWSNCTVNQAKQQHLMVSLNLPTLEVVPCNGARATFTDYQWILSLPCPNPSNDFMFQLNKGILPLIIATATGNYMKQPQSSLYSCLPPSLPASLTLLIFRHF